jgi:tetratricopeptide (TPR) repeat protein
VTGREAKEQEVAIQARLDASDLAEAANLAGGYLEATRDEPLTLSSLRLRAHYQAGRVAVTAGQLAQALEYLNPLLDLTHGLPPPFATQIHLLAAEALARLGQLQQAREQLDRLRSWSRVPEQDSFLRLCELRVRLWLGEVRALAGPLADCARALESNGQTDNLVLLLSEEGRAWDQAGDLSRAEQCWQRARELIERVPRRNPIHADVFLQLGRLAHLRGHLQDALDHFEQAERPAGAVPAHRLNVQLRRLWVLVDLGQLPQARDAFFRLVGQEVLPEEVRSVATLLHGLLIPDGPRMEDSEIEAYRALEHRGDQEAAYKLYLQAFEAETTPERRARLAVMLGMLAAARESADTRGEVERWLCLAQELAQTNDLPEVRWRALRLHGQHVLERYGDEDLARGLLEEAVRVHIAQAGRLGQMGQRISYREQGSPVLKDLLLGACRRGDAARVFREQELMRGWLVLELAQSPGAAGRAARDMAPDLQALNEKIEELEATLETLPADTRGILSPLYADLLLKRNQLWESYLYDRSRPTDAALPRLPELPELEKTLPPGTVYVAPHLSGDELFLLIVQREGSQVVRAPGKGHAVLEQRQRWLLGLNAQIDRYEKGFPLDRKELDDCLEDLGGGPLGVALGDVWHDRCRLVWVVDETLSGLPIHALRRGGRYLVEDHEVVYTLGGSLYVRHAGLRRPSWRTRRRALVVTAGTIAEVGDKGLDFAREEGRGVAAAFPESQTLHFRQATREAVGKCLAGVGLAHFACHACFDASSPLVAWLHLPSGERWHAAEWPDEPLNGLPLMTLSACSSAELAPLSGGEVFGLVGGLLAAGVRAVLGGMCRIPDRETAAFMWRFYRHAMTNDLAGALAGAQRETLAAPGSSPLFWAVFALFGDAAALPAPGWLGRWFARRRQRRHARSFPPAGQGER